jgi:hypothetical protein
MTTCRRCRDPVIETPDGRYLTPQPAGLGIWRPDGSKWSVRELREATRARHVIGHMLHDCKPLLTSRKPDDQAALF